MTMSNLRFFSLKKKLLVLVLSASLVSIMLTTILFLNFDKIPFFEFEENIIGIGLVLMAGISIITILLSKRLSEPITRLSEAANKIARGDFDVRTNIKSSDEIGQLSTSFDLMAQKLKESLITIKQKEAVIKQQEDILLNFSDQSEIGCVCLIDIKDSTSITANLTDSEISNLYSTFLNSMAIIVHKFNGTVIKNIGDALLFYFPKVNPYEESSLKNVLECCFAMCDEHDDIGKKLKEKGLPDVDYKISSTYGSVRLANTSTSDVSDIFGSTVNRCAKINGLAPRNGLIIGEDFYNVLKSIKGYSFKKMDKLLPDQEQRFVVYTVSRN
jgi:class 3 adenylate cyclase/HAMP domain-containing protein